MNNNQSSEFTLFHCHCTPICHDPTLSVDHPELVAGSYQYELDEHGEPIPAIIPASATIACTTAHRKRSKYASFTDDSKVSYDFNEHGFYKELLLKLKQNHKNLETVYTRAQQFLKHEQNQHPDLVYGSQFLPFFVPPHPPPSLSLSLLINLCVMCLNYLVPQSYQPYYPTQHHTPYISSTQYIHAEDVAKAIVAPQVRDLQEYLNTAKTLANKSGGREYKFVSETRSSSGHARTISSDSSLSSSSPPPDVSMPALSDRESYIKQIVNQLANQMSIEPESFKEA